MAEWQTPKTDWSPADAIGMGDLNRIEGNEVYLKEQSAARGKKLFTSSGTFVVPAGVTKVWVSMCGGGGGGLFKSYTVGGSDAESTEYDFRGGGGGASIFCEEVTVIPGESIYVTIGAGGGGGSNGTDGGATYFGSYLSCAGGKHGKNGGSAGGPGGSAGGSILDVSNTKYRVTGGSTHFGAGGNSNPSGYGAGAGGSSHSGAQGMCLVEW